MNRIFKFVYVCVVGSAITQSVLAQSSKMEAGYDYRRGQVSGDVKPTPTPVPDYNRKDPNLGGNAATPMKKDQFQDVRRINNHLKDSGRGSNQKRKVD